MSFFKKKEKGEQGQPVAPTPEKIPFFRKKASPDPEKVEPSLPESTPAKKTGLGFFKKANKEVANQEPVATPEKKGFNFFKKKEIPHEPPKSGEDSVPAVPVIQQDAPKLPPVKKTFFKKKVTDPESATGASDDRASLLQAKMAMQGTTVQEDPKEAGAESDRQDQLAPDLPPFNIQPEAETTLSMAEQESKPAKPLGFFQKHTTPKVEASEQSSGNPKATKPSSLFSLPVFGSKEPKEPSAKIKKSPGAKNTGTEAFIVVQLRDTTFWRLSSGDLAETEETTASQYISFSDKERRFLADKPVSRKEAQNRSMLETAQLMRVVNSSAETKAFYAVEADYVDKAKHRVAPGFLVLDRLLTSNGKQGQSLITGFVLTGQAGNTLVILFHVDTLGYMGLPEISANPKSLEFAISQFTASRKINKKDIEVLLFNNEDLLSMSANLPLYPNEPMLGGVTVRSVVNSTAGFLGILAVASGAWAGLGYKENVALQATLSKTKSAIAAQATKNSGALSDRISAFASVMTLNEKESFALAEQMWLPESKITMEVAGDISKYRIALPLVSNKLLNGKPAPSAIQSEEEVLGMMHMLVPKNCTQSDLSITGNMNEIQLSIDCQISHSGLSGFSND